VAVAPLDLKVPAGRTVALLGSSGCGKSTLLRIIVGLVAPDAGEVRISGTMLTAGSAQALRRRIGFVIQDGGLFPHLTARDNATLLARYLGRTQTWIDARVAVLAELVRLPLAALQRYPVQLSGGQRQRVSLMRALMLDPDLLLLDEPLGALDPIIRADLQTDLKQIFQAVAKTVLLVTHDVGEAGFLADEIALMQDGAIVQQGRIRDLLERPASAFVTRFLSAQRSRFAEGTP
jgi:osmoprotectant transport system ATP-binding protein